MPEVLTYQLGDGAGSGAVQGSIFFTVTLNSSVPFPVRPSVFCTWMSNCASAAVSAMSMVATICVALTYFVDLTVTPAGSVVPVLKNAAFAPFLKLLPPITTSRLSVAWSPDGGLAEVTAIGCSEAAGAAPPHGRPSITATSAAH